MEWQILIANQDFTKWVTALSLNRQNTLTGSLLVGNVSLALPPLTPLPSRCDEVVVQLNSNFPSATAEYQISTLKFIIKQSGINSEGVTEIEFAQLNGMGLSKAPIIGAAQRMATQQTAKRAGEIASSMLLDFGVGNNLTPFGLPQYDLQGSNDSDPFSQVGAICADHGLLMYVNANNTVVSTAGLSSLVNKSPALYPAHILEFTPIKQPELDELLVVGLEKTLDREDKVSYTETETINDEQTGEVKDIIITEVDEFGLEKRKVYTAMRFLRPDTHPNSSLMVFAEESWEEVKSDSLGRITKTIKYTDKNTAAISPESGGDSILIPAERVETTYRFDKETNELTSTLIETYQVFVIGKRESYTYNGAVLTPIKIGQISKPSNVGESQLSDEDKEVTVISPLVLGRTERVTYRKVGSNKWRETLTITARQLNSETNTGTSEGSAPTVNRITTLGGMTTISSKSKLVYSCPTVQTSGGQDKELKERVFRNLLKPTISNPCSSFLTRREQIEIGCNVDGSAFGQACALIRIDKLSPTVACSLRCDAASVRALSVPFSTLLFEGALWLVSNISLTLGVGESSDFAADFKQIKLASTPNFIIPLPPPKVEMTSLGEVIILPVVVSLPPLVEPDYPALPQITSQPIPTLPNVVGVNVPPAQSPPTLSQVSGTSNYLTQNGKLTVIALDTSQASETLTEAITVNSVVGSTTLISIPESNTPTQVIVPTSALVEDVSLPPVNVLAIPVFGAVVVENWVEIEVTISHPHFPILPILEFSDSDILISTPYFPVF